MVNSLIKTFQPFSCVFAQNGKKLYLVGGAVRDALLGKTSQDFDFATDATVEEVQRFFPKVIPTGIRHGTVTVLFQGRCLEVTTFRIDGKYSRHRRPDTVEFTSSLEEDLKRRDFTINALAIDLEKGSLIDYHGGSQDLQLRLLRAIGDPRLRFEEDALRILRLFRLSSQLNFTPEAKTYRAAQKSTRLLSHLSKERIHEELIKTLASPFPDKGFLGFQQLGILEIFFPEHTLNHCSDKDLVLLREISQDLRLSFLLLTWTPRLEAMSWKMPLHRLAFSNQEIKTTLMYYQVLQSLTRLHPSAYEIKKIFNLMQNRHNISIPQVLIVLARGAYGIDEKTALMWSSLWNKVLHSDDPIFLKDLALTGRDLLHQGWKEGETMSYTLRQLQHSVWKDPSLNKKDTLLQLAQNLQENKKHNSLE